MDYTFLRGFFSVFYCSIWAQAGRVYIVLVVAGELMLFAALALLMAMQTADARCVLGW